MEKFKWVCLLFIVIGLLLKEIHWPGGSATFLLGLVSSIIYCTYRIIKG